MPLLWVLRDLLGMNRNSSAAGRALRACTVHLDAFQAILGHAGERRVGQRSTTSKPSAPHAGEGAEAWLISTS